MKMKQYPTEKHEIDMNNENSHLNLYQTTITLFNNQTYSFSTNSQKQELLGGRNQEWKQNLENISQRYVKHHNPQNGGEEIVNPTYDLKKIKRTNFPIFLNPKTATFEDVGIHAKIRQYLSDSTIEKNLRYARFMQKHPVPLDFKNLTAEQFIRHMDYRIEVENVRPHALAHQRKAIMMFLRAFDIDTERWKIICKTPPITFNQDNIEIPFPSTVKKFFKYKYSKNRYENALLQSIAFIGFMFGMRPPSEICNLNLEDLTTNKDGTGSLNIDEQKKRGRKRTIIPFNKSVLSSPVFKSPKNYIKHWRPKVANSESENALFLQPNGKRITDRYVRKHLSPAGKKIAGKYFHLYTMRHTYATYLYEFTGDIKFVSNMLGHTKITNTSKYIHTAECMKRQIGKRNLFNLALRSRSIVRGKQKGSTRRRFDCWSKVHQLHKIPPVERSGLSRDRTGDLRRVKATS